MRQSLTTYNLAQLTALAYYIRDHSVIRPISYGCDYIFNN